MSNADIAREGFAAIARGDFDAVSDFLDPDVKWHGGNPADGCQNRGQALAWIRGRPQRTGGATVPELVDVVEAGNRVVVVMQPHPSHDDPQPQRTANLTSFRDGKVVEMVHYDDAADALAALGPAD
ncbi:MAG TPA: nuclear transport factor 2 family protein [Solirubrobacteraceae bacterium]|jgi:ketosteroid isomerase-like protein|nr:nuclear transport factor 2 family protein [Solirubrobacteraceae bacterium]